VILGYNTNGFSSHSLDDAIAIIAELGYGSIGLTVDHHALNPFVPGAEEELARCAELLKHSGLVPVVETGARFLLDPRAKHSPNLLDPDRERRARRVAFLCRCVDIAQALGASVVSLWSGASSCDADADTLDARLIEGLKEVCDKAQSCGIVVGFEPEPGMHIESMAHYDRIRSSFSHPAFQLTLDLGHAHLTESSVSETIPRYLGQIVNVHVEGMRKPEHDHLAPWDSGYDVREALRLLEELGYRGPATLELSRSSHDAVRIATRAFSYLNAS
jgi:sugar phosphate isomerase/epimerase